jgi:hypothetical protein
MSKELRYYRISEPALRELLMAAHTFYALQSWGVDNWPGWGEAQHNYVDDCSVIDEVHYDDMEEIVEADLTNYEICTCPEKSKPLFDTIFECMGLN